MSNKVQESVQNAQNGGQNPQVSTPVINGKKKKKGSTNQDLRERIKEITAQMQGLQEQVIILQKKSSLITPEMEELIELYNDVERYGDKCYNFVKRSMNRLNAYCGDGIDDMAYQAYKERFGKTIREMEKTIEQDLIGQLIDNISIYK